MLSLPRAAAACAILAFTVVGCTAPAAPSGGGPSGVSGGTSTHPAAASPAAARPSWARALGASVTVASPATPPAAQSAEEATQSPQELVSSYVHLLVTKGLSSDVCGFVSPAVQAKCRTSFGAGATSSGPGLFTWGGFQLGYTVIDGNRALVNTLGRFCTHLAAAQCAANSNSVAFFTTGKPFASIWARALSAWRASGDHYAPFPCVRVNGAWYLSLIR